MSTKKIHLYNMAFGRMIDLCARLGRPCTAGEFARYMGIARSTAMRWISEMLAEGAINAMRQVARNHQPMTTYEPAERGVYWDYDQLEGKDEVDEQ